MKKYLIFAALSGGLSVALGAFGAHGLRDVLSASQLNSFLTGIRYQVIHSLLILILALLPCLAVKTKSKIAFVLALGILLFSGSIYLLTTGLVSAKLIWFITPLGGLLLLLGWLWLAIALIKEKETNQ